MLAQQTTTNLSLERTRLISDSKKMDWFSSRIAGWACGWLALVLSTAAWVPAATPMVPDELSSPPPAPSPTSVSGRASALVEKVRDLAAQSKIPSAETFLDMLRNPRPSPVELLPASTSPMCAGDLARRAASAHLRVGWVYRCTKCSNWHTNLAGGYAIAPDAVVTAYHVLENSPQNMQPGTGYPVIVRGEDDILPIASVLAADRGPDTVILRIPSKDLAALPLADKIAVGDAVYCLSDPFGQRGIFTAGIVNCLDGHAEGSGDKTAGRRLIVSTDWAPGSSGSAVLDSFGNAAGHVDTIQTFASQKNPAREGKNPPDLPAAVLTLHFAVPASSVRALLESAAPPDLKTGGSPSPKKPGSQNE